MASSPSLCELPVGVAADGVAVPVLHPPRCSVCQFSDFNHPIFKGVYNCLCEVNSDLKVLGRDSKFGIYADGIKLLLRMVGFPIDESMPMVMACEIYSQLSDNQVKYIRESILQMKVAAMISMKFDSNEIPPDWCSCDLWWFGRINASGDFSFEREGVSSTEVLKMDNLVHSLGRFHFNFDPEFHFSFLVQMPDDPEQYESVVLHIPAENFKKKLKAPELGIAPGTSGFSEIVADYSPPRYGSVSLDMPAETLRQSNFKKISTGGSKLYAELEKKRTERAHLFNKESLEPVMSTKNLEPGTGSFMEKFGKRPGTLPVHCYEQPFTSFGGGNAPTPEDVNKIVTHLIDLNEQMAETKKKISAIGFSIEATDPLAKLNEIVIGITGSAAFSIMGFALTGSSSSSPASYFVVAAIAVGFSCAFNALALKGTKKPAARILAKVGGMAAASAVIVALGMFHSANTIWITGIGIVWLITVAMVALA